MKKIRAAVVGCGGIHTSHTSALAEMENVEIAAVCDVMPERAAKAAGSHSCIAFINFESLLDYNEFDVLHICTPHYLHAEMAIAALKKGKHVLCEKPMSIHYEDALAVIKTAEENNFKYGVCFQNRYNWSTAFIKELLDSGKLGAIKGARAFVTWNRDEKYYTSTNWRGKIATEGGGVLINQSIHTLDLMQWLIGRRVVDLKASVSTKRLHETVETEDTADLFLDFGGGVRATFYASLCYTENSPVFLEIVCENGKIVMSDDIRVCETGKDDICYNINHAVGEKAYWGTGHSKLITDFYDSIEKDKPFLVDGRAGAVSVEILERVYKYAR